jgi:formylglycine-generating enzyme required for sulfatase activity
MEPKIPDTYILSDLPTDLDALDFTPYVRTLVNILQSPETATPLTIGVFGTWGSGKTSLMRMVYKQLPDSFQKVWFDAWKYDKEETLWRALLLQVLSAVRAVVEAREPQTDEEIDSKEKALDSLNDLESSLYRTVEREELGKLQLNWHELLKGSVETALHVGISLVPGLRIAQSVVEAAGKKAVTDDPGGLLKAVEREKTKIYSEHIESLEQFQKNFKELVEQYIRPQKLVVFIDDLDRCMPEKAIEVLEAIKLFLDVEGCTFVLGLDQDVIARGVELKYRELGLVKGSEEKPRFLIDGTRYLEKIIQLPFQIPPIQPEDMQSFVNGLVQAWPDEACIPIFAEGLGDNPRQVKRTVNVFLLLWGLARERADKLQGRIKPVRLAKVVVIQNIYPELYELLKRTPRLLRELEDYYRAEAVPAEREATLTGGESRSGAQPVEAPPALVPFIGRTAIRRILTMHALEMPDASFSGLSPDELRLYFTLTRRAEAPQVGPAAELLREVFEPQTVAVPAGPFLMGSTDQQIKQPIRDGLDKDIASMEVPQHRMELPEYLIGKYPLTNIEYQAFVEETGHVPPRHWDGTNPPEEKGDHPVVNVTWQDAVDYCDWLSKKTGKAYGMPSEAEWEKAARGENGSIYPWGDEFDPAKSNTSEAGHGSTTPVGQFSPQGDSPYGCADMAGNVWEWTRSQYRPYPYDPKDGREELDAPQDTHRVLRGGSFDVDRRFARCASRYRGDPDDWVIDVGFRVVVSLPVSEL